MKRERAKDLLPIITAYSQGKVIECRDTRNVKQGPWEKTDEPMWLNDVEYRIKPEPRYIPFTFDDNLIGKVIIISGRIKTAIIGQIVEGLYIGSSTQPIEYTGLLNGCTFLDGSPCGKLSE